MKKEIWKNVKEFENKYEVSTCGNIRNKITGHILKMTNKNGDYFRIILYDNNKKKTYLLHRLIAETFIPNPNNLPCVNHKDMNKQNNCVNNLEWCTYSYNTLHGIKNGANTMLGVNKYNKEKFSKKYGKIYQYDLKGNLLNIYNSLKEAKLVTNTCERNILQVMNHQQGRKQANGYIWKCEKEVMNKC